MNTGPQPVAEIVLGSLGFIGALTLQEGAALLVAAVTIAAMLPLAYWRWRALLQGKPKGEE